MKKSLRYKSALVYVLVALIPYSEPNLLLTFKPGRFFAELAKISGYKRSTIQAAYYRGLRTGYIDLNNQSPRLTMLGQKKAAPFIAQKLDKDAKLVVIFDIPEEEALKRQSLRNLLKFWEFHQVQKSVWASQKDYGELLVEAVRELKLETCVQVYEALRLYPK